MLSADEYLKSVYDPDCDYVDGRLVERNTGDMDHGDAQSSCLVFVRTERPGYWAVTEVRVRVKPDLFRIPDVTIVKGAKPKSRIFMSPPLVAVEILSPDDRAANMQDKIDDYLGFGIRAVWVLNPATRRGYVHTSAGMTEAKDGILRCPGDSLEVPLSAVFNS